MSVARISALNGTVTVKQGDSGDTVAAAINAPMIVGDYLATGNGSRAEIQIDDANFVRASEDVQLRFTRMDPADHTLQLAAGTIELSLLKVSDGRPQVETPSIRIRPQEAGAYRVTVTADGDTLLTVRAGQAELIAPQGTQTISQGVTVAIHGSSANPSFRTIQTISYDDFDTWNSDRDKFAWRAYAATTYASPDIVGLADLSNYGQWISTSNYGYVWSPYSQYNWAPYRYGRWSWVNYCGWTWVGYEPWGWAPYHYGRWFYAPAFGWAWYPGPRYYQSYWQPALVAFFNFGGGGFGFGFGNIGWVPLAPYEPYYPYYNRVARVHNIGNTYGNSRWPGGVTAVRAGSFTGGSKYDYVPVEQRDLQDVTLAKGWLPVAPTKADVRFTQTSEGGVAAAPLSPHFAAMLAPKAELTFDQQRANALAISHQMTSQAEHATASTVKAQNAPGATGQTSAWSRFGPAGGQNQAPAHIAPVQASAPNQINSPAQNGAQHASGNTITRDETANVWSRFGPANAPSVAAVHTMANAPAGVGAWSQFSPGSVSAVHSPSYIPGMPDMMRPYTGQAPYAPNRYSTPSGGWSPHAMNMPQPSARVPAPGAPHGNHQ